MPIVYYRAADANRPFVPTEDLILISGNSTYGTHTGIVPVGFVAVEEGDALWDAAGAAATALVEALWPPAEDPSQHEE